MASISSPGIGSGLDINSIVSQLLAVESRPLLSLDSREAGIQANISAMGTLKGSLSNLKDAISSLSDGSLFESLGINSSDTEVFSASLSGDAQEGSFDVQVNRLAQRHKMGSDEFISTTTFGGNASDALNISVDGKQFSIDLSTARSMGDIRDAIMTTANTTGVTANIISGDNDKQSLVLTASESGYDERVQVSFGGTLNAASFGFETINTDQGNGLIGSDAELDASLVVDGITVTRGSNSITDVIEGVTLNIKASGSAKGSVAQNDTGVIAAIDDFVSNANQAVAAMAQTDGESNSLLRNIDLKVRQVLNDSVNEAGQFSYLAAVGITTNEDNTLSLDRSKLEAALTENRDSVKILFSHSESGIASTLSATLDNFVRVNGVVDSIVQGLSSQIGSIDIQRERLNSRLDSTERRLRTQFTNLDTLLSSLNTTSSFLTQQLDSLANIGTNNN